MKLEGEGARSEPMTARIFTFLLVAALAGCSDDLADAIEEVRAAAPEVCKDYCEDLITCEWPIADGDEEDNAFGAAIRRCTIDCAWFMSDGAYVVESGIIGQKLYTDKVSGKALREALECVYYAGGYRCSDEGAADLHIFDPPVESVCNLSGGCLGTLGLDYGLMWNPSGGYCQITGTQTVEVDFF